VLWLSAPYINGRSPTYRYKLEAAGGWIWSFKSYGRENADNVKYAPRYIDDLCTSSFATFIVNCTAAQQRP
jgi:hypothetical protein